MEGESTLTVEALNSGDNQRRFGYAVVIGKFYPPHRGHKLLIDMALARSERVSVIVCAKLHDSIDGELRGRWLAEIHPRAEVMVIDDRYDEHDTAVWAANTIQWLGGPPDAVFTSESYGEPYARAMGCEHVLVDAQRRVYSCSGTMVRSDPLANWDFLEPPVKAWFARRVCVLGAESTGTTTLAAMLAEHYDTIWVPEFGREYSAAKQQRGESQWTNADFVHIAGEQIRLEDEAARRANRVLIGDTNAFATCLWHRRYMGQDSDAVRAIAKQVKCDLYLLTGDEIPFVQDGLRDGERIRHEMHRWFEEALRSQSIPWQLVRGSPSERLDLATTAIDKLFVGSGWQPSPSRV